MDNYYLIVAKKLPSSMRSVILEEKLIEKCVNTENLNTPMEYLFNVYHSYIDLRGEHDNWNCPKCRQYVLNQWQSMLPFLKKLEDASKTTQSTRN